CWQVAQLREVGDVLSSVIEEAERAELRAVHGEHDERVLIAGCSTEERGEVPSSCVWEFLEVRVAPIGVDGFAEAFGLLIHGDHNVQLPRWTVVLHDGAEESGEFPLLRAVRVCPLRETGRAEKPFDGRTLRCTLLRLLMRVVEFRLRRLDLLLSQT